MSTDNDIMYNVYLRNIEVQVKIAVDILEPGDIEQLSTKNMLFLSCLL